MRSPDGHEFWYTGVYREIVAPERLVYTDSFADADGHPVPPSHSGVPGHWPAKTLVTVTFEERGGKTTLTMRQADLPAGPGREGAAAGWNGAFDKLAASLAGAAA